MTFKLRHVLQNNRHNSSNLMLVVVVKTFYSLQVRFSCLLLLVSPSYRDRMLLVARFAGLGFNSSHPSSSKLKVRWLREDLKEALDMVRLLRLPVPWDFPALQPVSVLGGPGFAQSPPAYPE